MPPEIPELRGHDMILHGRDGVDAENTLCGIPIEHAGRIESRIREFTKQIDISCPECRRILDRIAANRRSREPKY